MKILIVVAHADDETIAASCLLAAQPESITILHTTNSAPRNSKYYLRAGFATGEAYAASRRQEFLDAMKIVSIRPNQCLVLPVADQDAVMELPQLIAAIRALLPVDRILTHAYEGGHPDHDATALAVALAAGPTPVFEYPGYHAFGAPLVASVFLDHPEKPPLEHRYLSDADTARKHAMFACFPSQRHVFDRFSITEEQLRPAPKYNFLLPPHPGVLYYETRDMGITYPQWREHARAVLGAA